MANTLTSTSPQPVCITSVQNGNRIIRNDGTKKPLTNNSAFNFRHLFVVAKNSAATFSTYRGLVSGLSHTGWALVGNTGDTKFHPLSTIYSPTTWNARVNGVRVDEDKIPGPMNKFTLTHIYASSPVPSSGVSIGQDRDFDDRRWNGDIAEIIFYEKSLLESDVWEIEEYLMTKWGIV